MGLNNCHHCGELHEGEIEEQINDDLGCKEYRWICLCGSRGKWTIQSPDVPRYGFLRHLERHLEKHKE